MKSLFLLVLLSQNGAGDVNASFVNTGTLDQCRQKEVLVRGIFSSAGIPVVEAHCIPDGPRFSAFGHSETTGEVRHFYWIEVAGERLGIEPMPDWRRCMEARRASAADGRAYCASSIQTLAE